MQKSQTYRDDAIPEEPQNQYIKEYHIETATTRSVKAGNKIGKDTTA